MKTDKFIKKSIEIHGGKYNYSHVNYSRSSSKVEILCKLHGIFYQSPNNHLKGKGCPRCAGRSKTSEDFIMDANKIHGKKYDYSNVNYKNATIPICIGCKRHGQFQQTPHKHLCGHGCPKCGGSLKSNLLDFIAKAIEVHGNSYGYSHFTYKNAHTKGKIFCVQCKKFFIQSPNKHLNGRGCPICKLSHGERIIKNWLDTNGVTYIFQYRIKECRGVGNKPLPFDFFIPNKNILIEYDGEQHFRRGFFNGKKVSYEQFNKTKMHDRIKTKYALNNKIDLVRISYYEKDNIPIMLKSILKL